MTKVILELDDEQLRAGYAQVTKVDTIGTRKGSMLLSEVNDLLGDIFQWEAARRTVSMVSRFTRSSLIAFGANGAKWKAVKEIPPAEYYLVAADGSAHRVDLPRLIAGVDSHMTWPRVFWTPVAEVTPDTMIYPLIIGNTYEDGRVCTGNTGLKCKAVDEVDKYIRQLIETPATHTVTGGTEKLYRKLAERGWDQSIGKKHGISLHELLRQMESQL